MRPSNASSASTRTGARIGATPSASAAASGHCWACTGAAASSRADMTRARRAGSCIGVLLGWTHSTATSYSTAMTMRNTAVLLALAAGCAAPSTPAPALPIDTAGAPPYPASPEEPRLRNLRQLTHGGENAEAYFSADGQRLIFQATREGIAPCDQIFTMKIDGTDLKRVSTGAGRTTCAYWFPSGQRIVYSSTHHVAAACPAPPDRSRGYVWGLFAFDVFAADPDGANLVQLTHEPGYDAEATISP